MCSVNDLKCSQAKCSHFSPKPASLLVHPAANTKAPPPHGRELWEDGKGPSFFFFLAVAKISYERSNFSSRLVLLPSSVSTRRRDSRRAWMTHRSSSNVRALAHDSSWGSASPITRSFYIRSSSPAPRKYHVYLQNGWAEGERPLDGGDCS